MEFSFYLVATDIITNSSSVVFNVAENRTAVYNLLNAILISAGVTETAEALYDVIIEPNNLINDVDYAFRYSTPVADRQRKIDEDGWDAGDFTHESGDFVDIPFSHDDYMAGKVERKVIEAYFKKAVAEGMVKSYSYDDYEGTKPNVIIKLKDGTPLEFGYMLKAVLEGD